MNKTKIKKLSEELSIIENIESYDDPKAIYYTL